MAVLFERVRITRLHWLPVACLFEFGFAQLFKHSQRRGFYAPVVVSTNYLVLSGVLCLYFFVTGDFHFPANAVKVGAITGCVFICSMLVMTRALEVANVAAVLTAFRMAMIVPVVVGVWVWGETIRMGQVAGIGLAVLALFLMTRSSGRTYRLNGAKSLGLIALVFCCQGASHSCLRWVHYAGLDDQFLKVLPVIGATAGTLGAILIAIRRRRPRGVEMRMGAGIGLYNLVALMVILTTLSQVPGTVFFPVLGCTVVVLDNLSAHFLWKEPLGRPARVGAALAVVAILLVV